MRRDLVVVSDAVGAPELVTVGHMCARCRRYAAAVEAKRARWIAAGCCSDCGVPVARYRRCAACRTKSAAQKRRRRQEVAHGR